MKLMTREAAPAKAASAKAPGPRLLEDLPWRFGYRMRRFVMHIWGPPDLGNSHDPLQRLAEERAARYAARAASV